MEFEDNNGKRILVSSDQQFKSFTIRLGCSTIELTSEEGSGCVDVKIRGAISTCPSCSTQHTITARSTGKGPSEADSSSLSAIPVPAQHDGGGEVKQVGRGAPRANEVDNESTEDWDNNIAVWVVSTSILVITTTFNAAVNFRKQFRWGSASENLYIGFSILAFFIAVFSILLLICRVKPPGTGRLKFLKVSVPLQLVFLGIVFLASFFTSPEMIVIPNIIFGLLIVPLLLYENYPSRALRALRVKPTAAN